MIDNIKSINLKSNYKTPWYYRLYYFLSDKVVASWIYNKLRLPTPKELGKSDSIGLPMRQFSPFTTEYTWEDYHEEMKKLYPIRSWLYDTAFFWLKIYTVNKPQDLYWWFVHKFVRKEHLLDLRQPLNKADPYPYRYGYIDAPERIKFACFNTLVRFMEKEHPESAFEGMTPEELNDPDWKVQYESYKEAEAIYFYWVATRHDREKYCDKLHDHARNLTNEEEYEAAIQIWLEEYGKAQDLEDEMLMRLMRIRRTLWT